VYIVGLGLCEFTSAVYLMSLLMSLVLSLVLSLFCMEPRLALFTGAPLGAKFVICNLYLSMRVAGGANLVGSHNQD
jgi:hypothetical protein